MPGNASQPGASQHRFAVQDDTRTDSSAHGQKHQASSVGFTIAHLPAPAELVFSLSSQLGAVPHDERNSWREQLSEGLAKRSIKVVRVDSRDVVIQRDKGVQWIYRS